MEISGRKIGLAKERSPMTKSCGDSFEIYIYKATHTPPIAGKKIEQHNRIPQLSEE
jgi:hypothetical protein